ncbi:MAG TPA: ABC transporter substrate-binding protein [Microbacteriaceae bacterium]|jgi:iron complex transport system substrate-binding protein|nr:ABC transporter substrate-binding protein [Microbacteriaceae bacterium]HPZ33916.1 ABC transporter substrate-binding protein [Microbacteriaceae bacterium]
MKRTLRPARGTLVALAALMGLTMLLGGCTTTSASTSGSAPTPGPAAEGGDDARFCAEAGAPLASLPLLETPRTASGRATACLANDAIRVIDDETAPALPATVVDAEDREVTVRSVDRILALDVSGTIAATVFGLGLGPNVIGRDAATGFDGADHLPLVTGAGHTLAVEAILALEPTVILTDTTIGPKEVRQQLRDAGIAVVMISSERRLETAGALVTEVAAALGVAPRGEALATRLHDEIEAARREVSVIAPAEASDRVRVAFLYARGAANVYYLFGADSGADSLIDALGAVDVASEIGWNGMKPMTAEALVAAQPDALIMMTDGLASAGGVEGLLQRIPALAQTPAGQHGRVIDMADDAIFGFGPRSADVVRALARALYAAPDGGSAQDAAAGSGGLG